MSTVNVTIVGQSTTGLNALEHALQEDQNIDISRKLLRDFDVDPFQDLPVASSVIILDLGDNWQGVLDSVASRSLRNRTPMILIGPDDNTEMMRLALRAGARDFQTRPVYAPELLASVHRLASEQYSTDPGALKANMSVIMSAKGGAGSSAIITGLGHAVARRNDGSRILLIDLDLQYGNLPLYFDETSSTRLTQALIASERMDATLFDACVIKTDYGIDLLSSYSDQVFSSWETPESTVSNLLNLACDRYDHIFVDVPRQIDPITFQAMEMANNVCVVLQQSLSDLRYGKQVIGLLRDQGLPNDRLRILVNRYDKSKVLRVGDITEAFDGLNVFVLPNDYKRMSFATDNAVSLFKKYRKSPLSKTIVKLSNLLSPIQDDASSQGSSRGIFGRRKKTR